MTIDRYAPCPCGSGKKVKFCCCKDITTELERIQRMLEGDQRLACLEHINKLLGDGKERAALLAIKAMLEGELEQDEESSQTVSRFLAKCPDNPVALAEATIIAVAESGGRAGIEPLQKAIAVCDSQLPMRVYDALSTVGEALLVEGNILAARQHIMLEASMAAEGESEAKATLQRFNQSQGLPILVKDPPSITAGPADAPWINDFNIALGDATRCRWTSALQRFLLLREQSNDRSIVKNIAIVKGWLGDVEGAVAAWHEYAALDDVPLDDAVEAEALAQFIAPNPGKQLDVLSVVYPVPDVESLSEKLLSDPQVLGLSVDPAQLQHDDGPPAKAIYELLDRTMPTDGANLTVDDVPIVLGQLLLFGKQTDRDARVEFVVVESEDLEAKKTAWQDICGDLIGPEEGSDVFHQTSATMEKFQRRWRFPENTPPERVEELTREQQQRLVFTEWPEIENDDLDGKTPREVASDPAYKIRLLAAILRFELSMENSPWEYDFNTMRSELDLPVNGVISPTAVNLQYLPVVRFSRVDITNLIDENLVMLFTRANAVKAVSALRSLTTEMVSRESLDGKLNKAEAYGVLASLARTSDEAIEFVEKARAEAVANDQSPAKWLIGELELRIERGELSECQNLINTIRERHFHEPGVNYAMMNMLHRAGLVDPDAVEAQAAAEPEPSTVSAPAADAGGIWTPDGGQRPDAGKEKAGLWTPD